jgi:hypothetical protein
MPCAPEILLLAERGTLGYFTAVANLSEGDMKIECTHSFSVDEAKQRMQALTEYWQNRYGVTTEWMGNRGRTKGKVKGINFDARVDVAEKHVVCEADIGFLAERLGARSYVEKKLEDYLDPSTPVTGLPRS